MSEEKKEPMPMSVYKKKSAPKVFFDEDKPFFDCQLRILHLGPQKAYYIGDVVTMANGKPLEDGIYISKNSAIVISESVFVAIFDKVFNKYGFELDKVELQEDYLCLEL